MKNRAAFTLVEMIAVIVIIGIIVAVGIPAMSGLTRAAGLQGGVRQIANALQLTRQLAITHRTQSTLLITSPTTFSVFTNGVLVDKTNNLPAGIAVDFQGFTPPIGLTFKPTGGLVGNGADVSIVLREGGTNNTASLVGTNSNISTVTVERVLGRVAYQ